MKKKFNIPIRFIKVITLSFSFFLTSTFTFAAYPDKPVRLVVPFAPGGATDVVGRALALGLNQLWKQQVVVDNKPGAGGNIGADIVAKSIPDGYTLLLSSPAEVAINPSLYLKMPYDASKDLLPVIKVGSAPLVLVVNSKSNIKNLEELEKFIKEKNGKVNFASSGTGGPQHLAGELFKSMSGLLMTHIPYKGGAPAITDLLGGQVDIFFAGLPPALPHIASGKLLPIGVTSLKRTSLLPNVPTIAESGFPNFNIENWQGIFVANGTPSNIIDQLAKDIAVVMKDKKFEESLQSQGVMTDQMNPVEFTSFVQSESKKYNKLIKESGIKAD
jgi:tripartite-type tricarboxylate transporter receptor subunit TctC